MKTYTLTVTEAQLRIIADLLSEASTLASQIDSLLETPEAAPQSVLAAVKFMQQHPLKSKRVGYAQALSILAKTEPEAHKALSTWKSKNNSLHGWDRWFKSRFPSQAAILWPDWSPR